MDPRQAHRRRRGAIALVADRLAAILRQPGEGIRRHRPVSEAPIGARIGALGAHEGVRRRIDEIADGIADARAEHHHEDAVGRMHAERAGETPVARAADVFRRGQQHVRRIGQEVGNAFDIARGRVVIDRTLQVGELIVVRILEIVLVGRRCLQAGITRRRRQAVRAEHDQRIELAAAGPRDLARVGQAEIIGSGQLVGDEQAWAVVHRVARKGRRRHRRLGRIERQDRLMFVLDAQATLHAEGPDLPLIDEIGRVQHFIVVELRRRRVAWRGRRRDLFRQGLRLVAILVGDRLLQRPARLDLRLRLVVIAQGMRPVTAELVDVVLGLAGAGGEGIRLERAVEDVFRVGYAVI